MEKPGFYAILPSPVRYDRRLSASEKVFFAEITALSDQCGYCYAGNGYFSELYDTSDRTVQRWVKHLQELGYVAVTNVRDGAAMQRRISPLSDAAHKEAPETEADKNVGERHPVSAGDKNVAPTPTKMSPTPRQKCRLEQYKNNNTRENNTRAGARESVRDVLRESFPWNERLTEALLALEESRAAGKHPLTVDSKAPTASYRDFITSETRYSRLQQQFPERAEVLFAKAEEAAKAKYERLVKYSEMLG